jgi:hypothetical protein
MCVVAVRATDSRGAVAVQTNLVQLVSLDDSVPMVSSQPAQHAVYVGGQFSYRPRVWTRDPSAAIAVTVSSGPTGMRADASGLVTWTPTIAELGSHEATLLLATPFGSVTHTFVVSVLAP